MTNRIRYLKPDFFLDEDVAKLPPLSRLFFQGLWCHADREGRLEDRPQRLKVEIMPYQDDFDAEEALAILAKPKREGRRPYIIRYEVNGERFIQILSWARHQRPHKNEKASEIPPPPREQKPLSYKGRTQDGQEHDKGRSLEHGDCDCDCDCDGDGDAKPDNVPPPPEKQNQEIDKDGLLPIPADLPFAEKDELVKRRAEIRRLTRMIEAGYKHDGPVQITAEILEQHKAAFNTRVGDFS